MDPTLENWYSGSGQLFLFEQILDILNEQNNKKKEIHVGTDSDPNGKKYSFVTGIAILYDGDGDGSRYFWTKRKFNSTQFPTLRSRLELETYHSICVADMLRNNLNTNNICLHIDISSDPKNKSQKHLKSLKNYASSMGFEVKIKPNSWAATSIADRHAK